MKKRLSIAYLALIFGILYIPILTLIFFSFASSVRYFTDGCDTLAVATLNRCHYAAETIPVDVVTLVGVVDSYDGAPVLRLSDRRASLSQ